MENLLINKIRENDQTTEVTNTKIGIKIDLIEQPNTRNDNKEKRKWVKDTMTTIGMTKVNQIS